MSKEQLVFTNGCFDIVHRGHIELLRFCASLGRVVVGLNSDDSISRLKGSSRPVVPLESRKAVLESIRYVSRVEVFSEDSPIKLIEGLQPDVIVKGGDYLEHEIVGFGIAQVVVFPLVGKWSTSSIVQKARANS